MKENPHDPLLHHEFTVVFKRGANNAVQYDKDEVPLFEQKVLTKRETVSISKRDARINNIQVEQTHRWYEPVPVEEEPIKEKKVKQAGNSQK